MPLIKKPPEQIEAIVVGCGPAGIAAANALVDKGVEVLIVDAREKIGHPLRCGELTRAEYFDYFGIEPREGWLRYKDLHIRPYSSESEYINAPYVSISKIIVDRQKSEFEASRILSEKGAYVLENASVNGVSEWKDDHRVVSINSRGEVFKSSARIIFAADGPSSTIVRYVRPEEFLSPGQVISYYGYQISSTEKLNPLKLGVFKFPQLSPFYFWIFPNGEHTANVGLGMAGYRGHLGKSYLDNCIKQFHLLSSCQIDQEVIGWTPSTAPMAKPYDDGLLVVGGAAWLTSSIYGEGLWQAVFSGKVAADYYVMNKSQPLTAINLSGYLNSLELIYDELSKEYLSKLQTKEFAGDSL